jgi:hypothetical protein
MSDTSKTELFCVEVNGDYELIGEPARWEDVRSGLASFRKVAEHQNGAIWQGWPAVNGAWSVLYFVTADVPGEDTSKTERLPFDPIPVDDTGWRKLEACPSCNALGKVLSPCQPCLGKGYTYLDGGPPTVSAPAAPVQMYDEFGPLSPEELAAVQVRTATTFDQPVPTPEALGRTIANGYALDERHRLSLASEIAAAIQAERDHYESVLKEAHDAANT